MTSPNQPAHFPRTAASRRRTIELTGAILACLATAVFVVASAAATPSSQRTKTSLQQDANALVSAGAPGVVLFSRDGNRTISVTSGLGEISTKTPIRANDRIRVASVAKTYIATVVLQLVGEGKLRLTDTVEHWLPGLVPHGDAISIRQLLNHTSGLADFECDPTVLAPYLAGDLGHPWAPRKLVQIAVSHPPLFAPGTDESYSSTNYLLAGLIVEARTGHTLGSELSRRIFQPLHLRATSFPTTARMPSPHAHGYLVIKKPPATDVTGLYPFPGLPGRSSPTLPTRQPSIAPSSRADLSHHGCFGRCRRHTPRSTSISLGSATASALPVTQPGAAPPGATTAPSPATTSTTSRVAMVSGKLSSRLTQTRRASPSERF